MKEVDRDSYDLSQGRKTHLQGASTIQVRKYLRTRLRASQKVFIVEEDGYKFNVTRQYQRSVRKR